MSVTVISREWDPVRDLSLRIQTNGNRSCSWSYGVEIKGDMLHMRLNPRISDVFADNLKIGPNFVIPFLWRKPQKVTEEDKRLSSIFKCSKPWTPQITPKEEKCGIL